MDFKILSAPCSESPSLAMQKFRDDVITAHAHCRNRHFRLLKIASWRPGKALSLRIFKLKYLSNYSTFQVVLLAICRQ